MTLSTECVLYYVLRQSDVVGHLISGTIEHAQEGLCVYDVLGQVI